MNYLELEDRLFNIESSIIALRVDMIEYMEKNPKHNDRWLEARLRALEHQIKHISEIKANNIKE